MTSTTTRLRSVNPVQLGLVLGLIYAVLAIIVALLYVLFGAAFFSAMHADYAGMLPMMGIGLIVVAPFAYFVVGFLVGLIGAALFNLVAGWIGGIEVTFQGPGA
jgi:Na+-transporting NADH:ubiquinone oxidoreductase subunit NqrD